MPQNSFFSIKNSTQIEKVSINKFEINISKIEQIVVEICKNQTLILEVNKTKYILNVPQTIQSYLFFLLQQYNISKFLKKLVEIFIKQDNYQGDQCIKLRGGGCTVSTKDKKQKKLKELTRFQTSQNKTTQQSNYLLTKENNSQICLPQDSIIRLYRFGESVHSEFQKKYDKYIDEKKIQNDIKQNTQVFEMHQMFTKCIYNFKPLIAQNSEGYRIMVFEIMQAYQQYMLTGLVSSDQFIQKDIKEHINEIEDFVQYLKVKVKNQPCLDLVFLSEFYLDINKNRVGLDLANQDAYKKLADFMTEALIFSLKVAIAVTTGAVFELLPDVVEFVVKVCSELNNIREYHSNQIVKVDGISIKNMKFLFLFNLYKAKLDKFKGSFLKLPAEQEIEFFIEQFLIYRDRKVADQYLLYILVQINFLFDVVLYEKSSKSDFQGIKNVADLMHDFIDIIRQKSKNKEQEQHLKGFYNFTIKNVTFRFLAISILIKYRIILGKIPNRQEEQQQITIHLIHSLLSEKNDSVKVLFKKDQKLIDIAKQIIIDESLSQEVINYAIQRNNSMKEYQLDVVEVEQIKSKQDIEKQIIRCLYEKWEDDVVKRQQSNIEQKDDVLLEVIQFYVNQKISIIQGSFLQEDYKFTNAINDIFEMFLKPNFKQDEATLTESKIFQQKQCKILGILAEGGAGKSMLLKQIEVKLKEESEKGLNYLPLFIKCNSLDAKNPCIENYLESLDFPKEQIEKLKQSDWNKLILLDGFDEYSGNYFNIYSQLKISEWRNTLIIVSSRQEKLSVDDARLYFSIKDNNFNIIESSYAIVKLLEFQKKDIEIYYQQYFKKLSIQKEFDENKQKKFESEKIRLMEDCLQNKQIEKLLYLPINLYLFTRLIAEIQDSSKRNIIEQITDQISVQEYFFAQQFKREAIGFIDDQRIESKIFAREELIYFIIQAYFDYFQTIAMHMFLNISKKNFLQVKLKQIMKVFTFSQKVTSILSAEQQEELKQKIYFYENSNIVTRLRNIESIKNNTSGANNSDFINILDSEDKPEDEIKFDIIEFKHKSIFEYFAARSMKSDFDIHKEDIYKLPINELKQFNINKKTIINPGKNQSEYQILKKLYKLIQKDIDSQYFKETYYLDSIQHNNRYIQFLKKSSIKYSYEISEIDAGSSNLISALFLSNFQYPNLNLSKISFSKAYIPQQKDESINLDYCNLSEAYLKGSNLNILYANTKNANFHNIQLKFNSKNAFSYQDVVIGNNNTLYTLSTTGYLNEFRIFRNDFIIIRSQCISQEPLFNLNLCNNNLILHTNNTLLQVNMKTFRNQNQKRFPDRIKSICVSTYNQIFVIINSNQCYYGSFEFDFVQIKNLKGSHAVFSPTGNYLLITNNENKLEIRKVSDNFNIVTTQLLKIEKKIIAAFSSDDSYLVVAYQNTLTVLKHHQNQYILSEIIELDKVSYSEIVSVVFSKNDQFLVISSKSDSQVREFVQVKSLIKQQIQLLNHTPQQTEFQISIQKFKANNQTLQFTPDSRYLLAFNSYQISIYDQEFNLVNTKQQNPQNQITAFAISPDESHIVLYSSDYTCKILNTLQNYQLEDQYENNTLTVTSMAFSSDGIYFAVCFADKTCYIRNAKNMFKHKTEIQIELQNKCIVDFCKRDNKEYLNVVSDLRYYVIDVQNDFNIIINEPLENITAAISKNGSYIAYCNKNSIAVFNIYDKAKIIIREDKYFDDNKLIAFSGDSKYVAQSFEKNKCQIWLLEKQQKKTLTCHDQLISYIAFSGDGKYFATCSLDLTCKIWSVNTDFDLIDIIDCSTSRINYLSFYPHRNILVACDLDFSFQLWDVEKVYHSYNKKSTNQGEIISAHFSSDDKYLAIGTTEGYCRIWNTKTFKSLFKIKMHTKPITQVVFSSNGKYLITGSEDKSCKVIEIHNNNFKLMNVLIYHYGKIIQIAISQDCQYLATSSVDKKCNIWNIKEGFKFYSSLQDSNQKVIQLISISVDSYHIACCSEQDQTLKIYTLADLKLIYKKDYKNPLLSLMYSSDGNYLITCTQHGSEILSKFNYQILFSQQNELTIYKSLSISPDSNYFVVMFECNNQNDCSLIKVHQGFQEIYHLEHISSKMNQIALSNDSNHMAIMSDLNQFKIWNKQKNIKQTKVIKCNKKAIYSACFSKDGKFFVTSSSEDICEVWNAQDEYRAIKDIKIYHNQQRLDESDYSTDEVDMFVQNSQRLMSKIELTTEHSTLKKLEIEKSYDSNTHIFAVAFSYDDKYLATGSSDKTCKIWTVENKFEIYKTLTGHQGGVSSVSFSPDGSYLVTGSKDNTCRIWSIENGFELHQIINNNEGDSFPISSISFSTYGQYLATGSYDNSCKIWEVQRGFQIYKKLIGHKSHIYSIAFSDNEKYFASGSSDSTCKIWGVDQDFKLIKTIEFHRSGIYAVAFSKQSKYLATGSYDNTCGIWSVDKQFQLLNTINSIVNGVYSIIFSPDGEQVITGMQLYNQGNQTNKIQSKLQISQIEDTFTNTYTL